MVQGVIKPAAIKRLEMFDKKLFLAPRLAASLIFLFL